MTFALCYPTHANCREQAELFKTANLDARCYPLRISEGSRDQAPNCWNEHTATAEKLGFPVIKSICPLCPHRQRCLEGGYLEQLRFATEGEIVLMTHQRAAFAGLAELTRGRSYVSIHENPLDLLRPRVDIVVADLISLRYLLNRILNEPFFLDRFAPPVLVDDHGAPYQRAEAQRRRERQYDFCRLLADLIDDLIKLQEHATVTTVWQPTTTAPCPQGTEAFLFWAVGICRLAFRGQPFRFLLLAASGQLASAAVLVGKRPSPSEKSAPSFIKKIVGFAHNPPARGTTTWINDATMSLPALRAVLGTSVRDCTPAGRIARQKKAVQIPRDVTRNTKDAVVAKILRGVLSDRPEFPRVGLITHRPLLSVLDQLEPEFRRRIVMSTYFGSGQDRSSNAWHTACDLIIIAGTPRVGPLEVASLLLQIGDHAAAGHEPRWEKYQWEGHTEAGGVAVVTGSGYVNSAWRQAHQSLVRAGLVQAIGRGRGILVEGCEVVVISNEECDLPLSDGSLVTLNDQMMRLLARIRELTETNPKIHSIGKISVSSAALAQPLGLTPRQVRNLLTVLERQGLIARVGDRGGWYAVPVSAGHEAPSPVPLPELPPA